MAAGSPHRGRCGAGRGKIHHRGHTGPLELQGGPEGVQVDLLFGHFRAIAPEDQREPPLQRQISQPVADAVPRVMVGADQAGHGHVALQRSQRFVKGAAGGQRVVGADGLDLASIHDDRAFADDVFAVPERQDAVGANQDSAHGRLRNLVKDIIRSNRVRSLPPTGRPGVWVG